MHQVVGAGCADGDEAGGIDAVGEREDVRCVLVAQDATLGTREEPAQGRQHSADEPAPLLWWQDHAARAPKGRSAVHAPLHKLVGLGDDRHGVGKALLGGLSPGDQSVLGEDDKAGAWVISHRQRHLAAEAEAGAEIGDPDQLIPKELARQALAVGGAGQKVRGIGMRVVHLGGREERVQ